MKIREGHVSNSSSSAYILITTKDNFEAALKKAKPLSKAIAEIKAKMPDEKFLGREMVKFVIHGSDEPTFMGYHEEFPAEMFSHVKKREDEEEYEFGRRCDEEVEKAWDKFVGLLCKNKNETITHYESW